MTKAIIMKFINSPKKVPQPILTGPRVKIAAFQSPPGIKTAIIGIMILSTIDLIKAVAQHPWWTRLLNQPLYTLSRNP